jgi:hypothetical protein
VERKGRVVHEEYEEEEDEEKKKKIYGNTADC